MDSGISVEEFDDVMMLSLDDISESIEAIEAELAQIHKIRTPVRMSLIRKILRNELVEDDLVARWHQLYATLLRCAKDSARERPDHIFCADADGADIGKGAAVGGLFFDLCYVVACKMPSDEVRNQGPTTT